MKKNPETIEKEAAVIKICSVVRQLGNKIGDDYVAYLMIRIATDILLQHGLPPSKIRSVLNEGLIKSVK